MSTGNFTHFLRDNLLDEVFGGESYTPPAELEIALGLETSDPQDDGTGFNEVTAASYERVVVANNLTNWATALNGFKTNDTDFEFPEAQENWGNITHFAIFDDTLDDNMLAWGELTIAKEVQEGDVAIFRAGDIEITMQGEVTT